MPVVAIEEHFWSPGLRDSYGERQVGFVRRLTGGDRLDDIAEARIAEIDAAGIDLQVLSQWQPGAQDLPPADAVPLARDSNDFLHAGITRHPERFAGFATLPTAAPDAAADELERAVARLGFKGALINGHTDGEYLDEPKYWPILERAAALGVPIYLHPRSPHPDVMRAYFKDDFTLSQAAWGYAVETGTHALRLIMSGVFERLPRLRIILGHLGECIPYYLWRFDHSVMAHAALSGAGYRFAKRPREVFRDHFLITTSGAFDPIALRCAISVLGAERVLFATDYPVESLRQAVEFLREAPLEDRERDLIASGNAVRELGLDLAA
jgi:predicted TIM-barrel fold metal-dependent hydrolase